MDATEIVGISVGATALAGTMYKSITLAHDAFVQRRDREMRIDKTLEELMKNLAIVKAEVTDNGGGSLKDAVLSLKVSLGTEIATRRMNEKAAMWEGLVQDNGEVKATYVSPAWIKITGLTHEDTDSGGWARCIAPIDNNRERVTTAAMIANREGRTFEAEYTVRNVITGELTPVHHVGMPIRDSKGRLRSWIGLMTPL